jgi:hypothetical protein
VPQLSEEYLSGFRTIFDKAVGDLSSEMLVEKSGCGSTKKRAKTDDGSNKIDYPFNKHSLHPKPQPSSTMDTISQENYVTGDTMQMSSLESATGTGDQVIVFAAI